MNIHKQLINGVFIERITPKATVPDLCPLVFVHGGAHGSWVWENFLHYFASSGRDSIALNWYHHNGSKELERDVFLTRSIDDVSEEIEIVINYLDQEPILVGHSMGGLAILAYAAKKNVKGMVLLSPCVPKEIGGKPIEVPVDFEVPWGPPPFEMAYSMFFMGMSISEAKKYYQYLTPESPQAVYEATQWELSVNLDAVEAPALVFSGEHDMVCPKELVKRLASRLEAKYVELKDRSHNVVLDPRWTETARIIKDWLEQKNY